MEHTERSEYRGEFSESQDRGIKYKIQEHIGVLSETKGWKKELNVVSWNDMPSKFDIREWDEDHEHMRKGLTLTKSELRELRNLLNDLDLTKIEVPETRSRRHREEPQAVAQAAAGESPSEDVPF